MSTSYYEQSSMICISQTLADAILGVTEQSDADTNDRIFTLEFLKTVKFEDNFPNPRFGISCVQIVTPRDDDPDQRPMLWMGVYDYYISNTRTAAVLQKVLQQCDSDEVIVFDWMEHNSTMRVSETVGVLCYVTASTIKQLSTKSMIQMLYADPTLVHKLPWADEIYTNPAGNYRPR